MSSVNELLSSIMHEAVVDLRSKMVPVVQPLKVRDQLLAHSIRAAMIELKAEGKWEAPKGRRTLWRKEKPDGKGFEYRETPPEEGEGKKEEEHYQERDKNDYQYHVTLKKNEFDKLMSKGHSTMISAGKNPSDTKEKRMKEDDPFFHERHEKLRKELEKRGLRYTEVVGHYGGKESSYVVFHDRVQLTPKTQKSLMVHHLDESALRRNMSLMEKLGRKYNQNSVLHGNAGKNEMVFTSGDNKGKKCGGKGWKEMPDAKDFFTDIKLEGLHHTKFQLDLAQCFKEGLL